MDSHSIIFTIFLIFTGAAILATLALYARQAMILAYIALGVLVGPSVLGWVEDSRTMAQVAEIGIMFLLFLLGLNLYPQKLLEMLKEATAVTLISCSIFAAVGVGFGFAFGFGLVESLLIGAAMMFSSTIIGLKLLPTTALHHRHAGEIIISVLLIQDIIAILILVLLQSFAPGTDTLLSFVKLAVALPVMIASAFVVERYILVPLVHRFDSIFEYVFLLAIGWCLGLAQLGYFLGLSYEIGAFIAGVTLATNPIARFIAESLKPLRDFFLIIFFFTLGAQLDLGAVANVALASVVLAALGLAIKPLVFRWLLVREGETAKLSTEIGTRLGQISEFSLLIAVLALTHGVISEGASTLIQTATLIAFAASSWWIVMRLPTPMAVSDKLRRD